MSNNKKSDDKSGYLSPEDRALLMMVRFDFAIAAFKNGQHIDRELLHLELKKSFEEAEQQGARRNFKVIDRIDPGKTSR